MTVAATLTAAMSLIVPMASATVISPYRSDGKLWAADPLPAIPEVAGHNATGNTAQPSHGVAAGSRELRTHKVTPAVWPKASTSTVLVGSTDPSGAVKLAAPTGVAKTKAPTSMKVETADRAKAQAANVDGLLVGLQPVEGSGGSVSVALDYGSIAQAYGGGWASRLHLVQLPACALTTPQEASCRTRTPLETVNDPVTHKLTATVQLPTPESGSSAARADAVAFGAAVAAVADTGGSQGSYTATSLSASGSWGSTQGAFTYSYPIAAPASLGGSSPSVALSYNSQSVDGKTSARNSQASWIGDGWDYSPGFVERSYRPCSGDGITDSGDECWAGWNATLSLGSHSGELIRDSSGVYHLQSDDGTKIEDLTGASNGLWNGEYFKVTTTDGTQYYLGLNHAPGTTSDAPTNSAWGVPVYHPNAGDPCYSSGSGKNSLCSANLGYRFNIDFVVDANGNTQRYAWATETSYYNRGYGQVASSGGGGTLSQYTRGGYLTQISYGYKLADAQAGRDPAAKIVFDPAQRCVTSDSVCQYGNLSATTATNWPDVPYNLNCTSGMATSGSGSNVCQVGSPTFWSTVRLKSITTKVKTAGGWQDVDSYTLTHLFSDAGGVVDPVTGKTVDPANVGQLQSVMWLSQIQHTGLDTSAGSSVSAPLDPVVFSGIEMNNRVDGGPAAPPLWRPRISAVRTETGASITAKYRDPECSRVNGTMPASPDSNTMACFPVYWNPSGVKAPVSDWFHKTLVAEIGDNDLTKAGSPARVTRYTYQDGAAWHRDDSDLTDDQYRTWNDFRGYRTIVTTTGTAPDPTTQSVTSYFQGMDGDYKADGSKRSVSLTNSLGESTTDSPWLAGSSQESDVYDRAGGTVVGKSLSPVIGLTDVVSRSRTAWTSMKPTGTLSALPDLTARRATRSSVRSMALKADGSWRTTSTETSFDSLGRPEKSDDKGDLTDPSQEVCTTASYAAAPASNPMMLTLPKETVIVSGPCTTAPGNSTTLDHRRFYYDGDGSLTQLGTLGSVGGNGSTVGLLTSVQNVSSYDVSGNPVFQTNGATKYDSYGRVTRSMDALGNTESTVYTPAVTTLPTGVTATNPLGWTSSSTMAPARGLVTHAVDVNGKITDATYDALGRRTQIWMPGRDRATQTPDRKFSYAVHGTGDHPDPSTVTSQTLREGGTYNTSVAIYDGFLGLRQTQSTTANDSPGRLIASTKYDSHGWQVSSVPAWADPTTAPGTTLFNENENSLPSQTVTRYDGLGRPTARVLYKKAQQLWQSTTSYPGVDRIDSTPPPGGSPTTVITDARGRTVSSTVHGGTGIGDATSTYGYRPSGEVTSLTDAVGNTWTTSYDLLGRMYSKTDPGSGTSTITYDTSGRVATTTDARQQTISNKYDTLGRLIGTFDGASTTDPTKQLTGYVYDTLQKGYPTSSTRYIGGSGAGGSAYIQEVTGYNTAYQSAGSKVTIPAAEGKLAGIYSLGARYTPDVGRLDYTDFGADGTLPAESVNYAYDLQNELIMSGSGRFTHYLSSANYSPLGQILQSTYGDAGKQYRTAQTYDDATGRLMTNRVSIETGTNALSDTTYGYDQTGNLTTVSELQSTGASTPVADTQCFGYDGLDRLTTAWTDTAGITTPTTGQLAKCNTASPAPATIGGPAPYWQTWQYNLLGDRTKQVQHDVTGNIAKDITQTSVYPGNGTAKANQPNAVTTVTTTGPTGTTTLTPHYDAAGNTKDRVTTGTPGGTQTFTYDAEGRTKTVNQNTSYLYDADGSLLIQRNTANAVLYLFGGAEQLTLDNNTKTVSGLRYYRNPDGTTIVRSSNGTVTYQPANHQGTAQLQVDANTLGVTRRSYDPYGNPRGTQPTNWADNHGYLGKPADPTTGLNLLGARNYDPALGRFLTVDPVLEAGDPNQMGGYTYAGDNPSTHSDPSGLSILYGNEGQSSVNKPVCGITVDCSSENEGGYRDMLAGFVTKIIIFTKPPLAPYSEDDLDRIWGRAGTNTKSRKYEGGGLVADLVTSPIAGPEGEVGALAKKFFGRFLTKIKSLVGKSEEAAQSAAKAAAAKNLAKSQEEKNAVETGAREEGTAVKPDPASPEAPSTPKGEPAEPTHASGKPSASTHSTGGGEGACSFSPDTQVLMGNGTTKPIADLTAGDQVEAADPDTGADQGARTVTITWINHDEDLVDVTVQTGDGSDETIHTTSKHPFWDATTNTWAPAGKLEPGHDLVTRAGSHLRITAVTITPGAADRYNLTVTELHTYYVLAGTTPVLVHNCKTDAELQADADAIHETWRTRYGDRAYNGTTVTTGHLDGELVYTVNRSKINPDATDLAESLGYRRVFGVRLKGPNQTDAEQLLLNAVDGGEAGSSGRIATSRVPCGPERQDCGGRIGSGKYPNIRVVGRWGAGTG
ncbi:polymorphic toxin-type HINT domain-containing protein [Kitasatospora griseola]|uniref:polymorphic toxin-type HINT domain-containing protein n=1 Tax=Kitasatospora griseola TaxID=2064 RepID=UPI0036DD8277